MDGGGDKISPPKDGMTNPLIERLRTMPATPMTSELRIYEVFFFFFFPEGLFS